MTKQDELRARKGLLSVRELSECLGSHIQTVYTWTQEGKLPFFRIGGRVKFDPAQIADWLDRRSS